MRISVCYLTILAIIISIKNIVPSELHLIVKLSFGQLFKKISYFWGYRDHVVIDAQSELPIWNITKPANVFDTVMFIPLFDLIRNNLSLNIEAVLADGIYDTSTILRYIL